MTGLDKVLDDTELVASVFAPTNAAFEAALKAYGWTAEEALAESNVELLKKVRS